MPDPGDRPNFVSKGELLAEIERLKAAYHPDFTVQSELSRCGKEIAALNIENERLKGIIAADTHILLSKRPVAWRVSYGASGWLLFDDEQKAVDSSERLNGAMMQGLYARGATI